MNSTNNGLENTYSTPEVAIMLRICPQRVRQLVADGRLEPVEGIIPYRFTEAAIRSLRAVWPRPVGAGGHTGAA